MSTLGLEVSLVDRGLAQRGDPWGLSRHLPMLSHRHLLRLATSLHGYEDDEKLIQQPRLAEVEGTYLARVVFVSEGAHGKAFLLPVASIAEWPGERDAHQPAGLRIG